MGTLPFFLIKKRIYDIISSRKEGITMPELSNTLLKSLIADGKLNRLPLYETVCKTFDGNPTLDYRLFEKNSYLTNYQKVKEKSDVPFITKVDWNYSITLIDYFDQTDIPLYLYFFYLLHEYYHIATTSVTEDKIKIGFYERTHQNEKGFGINEGCTQLWVCRDFNLAHFSIPIKQNNKTMYYNASPIETSLACLLGHVVGFDTLKQGYMKAQIENVLDPLTWLSSQEEANKFIQDMDDISMKAHAFYQNQASFPKEEYESCRNYLDQLFEKTHPSSNRRDLFTQDHVISFHGTIPTTAKVNNSFKVKKKTRKEGKV